MDNSDSNDSSASEDDDDIECIAGVHFPLTSSTEDPSNPASSRLGTVLTQIETGLASERPFKPKSSVFGILDLTTTLTHVSRPSGVLFTSMGFTCKKATRSAHVRHPTLFLLTDTLLYPEECLFLVERGSLIIQTHLMADKLADVASTREVSKHERLEGIRDADLTHDLKACMDGLVASLSLQECYALLLSGEGGGCSVHQYQAYAFLKRAGYIVFRHERKGVVEPPPLVTEVINVMDSEPEELIESPTGSVVGFGSLELPPFIRNRWQVIEKWVFRLFFVLVRKSGRFKWRKGGLSIGHSHKSIARFILFMAKAAWKFVFQRIGMICWSILWHRSNPFMIEDQNAATTSTSEETTQTKSTATPAPVTPLWQVYPHFDVYSPNAKFKKSDRGVPDFYLLVVSGDDPLPGTDALAAMFEYARSTTAPKVPQIKVGIVDQGKVSFVGVDDSMVDPLDESIQHVGRKKQARAA
ncbi:hypothetical protein HDU98_001398 [Podochytrium sp. JEL0797]|nr:hypothetical protein HDU98_001398 [Podochytrium sp. JEL0797]